MKRAIDTWTHKSDMFWTSLLVMVFMLFMFACPTKEAKEAGAEASYAAALLRCVEDAKTLAESKACREKVDRAWGGASQTVTDASRPEDRP